MKILTMLLLFTLLFTITACEKDDSRILTCATETYGTYIGSTESGQTLRFTLTESRKGEGLIVYISLYVNEGFDIVAKLRTTHDENCTNIIIAKQESQGNTYSGEFVVSETEITGVYETGTSSAVNIVLTKI